MGEEARYEGLPDDTRRVPDNSKMDSFRSRRVGNSKHQGVHQGAVQKTFSSKMADAVVERPFRVRAEMAHSNSGEQKEQKYGGDELQKIDSANEELMRFRKLRQTLREGL